jgi:hypothetical protein
MGLVAESIRLWLKLGSTEVDLLMGSTAMGLEPGSVGSFIMGTGLKHELIGTSLALR